MASSRPQITKELSEATKNMMFRSMARDKRK